MATTTDADDEFRASLNLTLERAFRPHGSCHQQRCGGSTIPPSPPPLPTYAATPPQPLQPWVAPLGSFASLPSSLDIRAWIPEYAFCHVNASPQPFVFRTEYIRISRDASAHWPVVIRTSDHLVGNLVQGVVMLRSHDDGGKKLNPICAVQDRKTLTWSFRLLHSELDFLDDIDIAEFQRQRKALIHGRGSAYRGVRELENELRRRRNLEMQVRSVEEPIVRRVLGAMFAAQWDSFDGMIGKLAPMPAPAPVAPENEEEGAAAAGADDGDLAATAPTDNLHDAAPGAEQSRPDANTSAWWDDVAAGFPSLDTLPASPIMLRSALPGRTLEGENRDVDDASSGMPIDVKRAVADTTDWALDPALFA